ncbi:MAG: VOC family protein [Lacrimispora sphenoides]
MITVDDVDGEFERLKEFGIEIVDPPTLRPWCVKNMSFLDPDNNLITFRCFLNDLQIYFMQPKIKTIMFSYILRF